MLASWGNIRRGTTPITAVPDLWLLNQDRLPYDWLLTMVRSTSKSETTQGVFLTWKIPWSVLPNAGTEPKMDKRSGFWQVDLTAAAWELLAFITPKGRVFKWKVMPFGVANASALFQELMNNNLYILRRRPLVLGLISRGAEMEAHIDDVNFGIKTKEDHVLLLREFFIVCQENDLRIKLEKCDFMKEEMEYLGFDVQYGWWKPATSRMQPLQDMQICGDLKKGLHDARNFVGACNFYRRHIHNFTYSCAPLTDLIKKTTPWRWTAREEE